MYCHKGEKRVTGETYFSGHSALLAKGMKELIPLTHPDHVTLVCIGYDHDVFENKKGVDILKKNKRIIFVKDGMVYFDNLVKLAEKGEDVAYGLSKITHRHWEGEPYRVYYRNLTRFLCPDEHLRRLDTGTVIVKEKDKELNINPDELDIAKTLPWSKRKRLEGKLEKQANSYAMHYGAMSEFFLNIESVAEHGKDAFPWDKIREMMIQNRINALMLTIHPFEKIIRSPENRKVFKQPNYVSILEEIIERQRQKIIEIKRSSFF
jgi:hypothetical protein